MKLKSIQIKNLMKQSTDIEQNYDSNAKLNYLRYSCNLCNFIFFYASRSTPSVQSQILALCYYAGFSENSNRPYPQNDVMYNTKNGKHQLLVNNISLLFAYVHTLSCKVQLQHCFTIILCFWKFYRSITSIARLRKSG